MALLERQINKVVVGPKELAVGLAQRARLLREALHQALVEAAVFSFLLRQWHDLQAEMPGLSASQFVALYAQLLTFHYFARRLLKLETNSNSRFGLFKLSDWPAKLLAENSR